MGEESVVLRKRMGKVIEYIWYLSGKGINWVWKVWVVGGGGRGEWVEGISGVNVWEYYSEVFYFVIVNVK